MRIINCILLPPALLPPPGVGVQYLHLTLARLHNMGVAVANMADVVDAVQILKHLSLQRTSLLSNYLVTILIIQILPFSSNDFQRVTFEKKFAGWSNMFLA